MEERKKEFEQHEAKKAENNKQILDIKEKIAQAETSGASDLSDLKEVLKKLEKVAAEIKKKDEELKKKEKVSVSI